MRAVTAALCAVTPVLLLAAPAQAADPVFTQQGRVLDAAGVPVNAPVTLGVSLFATVTAPSPAWTASYSLTPQDGYYSVQLGPDPALTATAQANAELWLQLSVDGVALGARERLSSSLSAAQGGGAGLRWDVAEQDFGVTTSGTTRTLTLTNGGGTAATGLVIRGRGGFTVTADTCAGSLAAGGSCTASVSQSGSFGPTDGTLIAASPAVGSATALLTGNFLSPVVGSGLDGDLVVSSTIDLTAQVAGPNRSGVADAVAYAITGLTSTSATLAQAPAGLAVGDLALIALLQASDPTDVGNYDAVFIESLTGNTVNFLGSVLTTDYDQGTSQRLVLQRIPQYHNVTVQAGGVLTTSPWDALSGTASPAGVLKTGIVAFYANGTVTINGAVTATAKGYRGGPDNTTSFNEPNPNGWHGEGPANTTYPTPAVWPTSATDGGGSGGWVSTAGCCHGNGGGGGGYGSPGAIGTIDSQGRTGTPTNGATTPGGSPYGLATLTRLFPGGGGGSGASYSGTAGPCDANDAECNKGGPGGGVVLIRADQLLNTGTISADGQGGWPLLGTAACTTRATTNTQDGTGGAGAGGSVLLQAVTSIDTSAGTVRAVGGPTGCLNGWPSANSGGQQGGAGGNGRVRLESPSITGTASPTPSTATF